MAKESDWATYSMMEFPFWRNGMMPEEFEIERDYFYRHVNDWKKGKYRPLWVQKKYARNESEDANELVLGKCNSQTS